ncbi:cytochrome c [Mucilaginibacter sp. Bleaf8]|uniref:c-type cytochrome n=1 Tax=Mucilaginibacter sp. Bleaf8 TaxID=2834430 RepID=UPI001BCD11B3|nr:cytochrome c [Mucilaginibacter sp. Bleaf8]MBS7565209.1 cytochrome c [Mucilaginibacter sp. Bleaf8]
MRYFVVIALLLTGLCALYACQNEQEIEFKRYFSAGQLVYQTRCQNCHGNEGQGLAALIPPLNDAEFLRNNHSQLVCYLQNGLKGDIIIHNSTYNGHMPASGLSPIETAQVITYVQNSFGNQIGLYDLKQAEADLKKCK